MDLLFTPSLLLGTYAGATGYPISQRIYSSHCDKDHIYRLRYRAFRKAGWIAHDEREVLTDRFDDLASCYSIAAFFKERCVGSVRLVFGGRGTEPCAMPCELEFPREIAGIHASNTFRLVEFSRMAIDPEISSKTLRAVVFASLVRAGLIVSYAKDADFALAAVHQRLARLYEVLCGFRFVANAPSYVNIHEPTHLLAREFPALDFRRHIRNAFFRITTEEIAAAREVLLTLSRADAHSDDLAPTRRTGT